MTTYRCISVDETKALVDAGNVTLVDIRDSASYHRGSIQNAVNILEDTVGDFLQQTNKAVPLVVYCYHGNSSKGAAEYFVNQGFVEVYSMDGGFDAWCLKY